MLSSSSEDILRGIDYSIFKPFWSNKRPTFLIKDTRIAINVNSSKEFLFSQDIEQVLNDLDQQRKEYLDYGYFLFNLWDYNSLELNRSFLNRIAKKTHPKRLEGDLKLCVTPKELAKDFILENSICGLRDFDFSISFMLNGEILQTMTSTLIDSDKAEISNLVSKPDIQVPHEVFRLLRKTVDLLKLKKMGSIILKTHKDIMPSPNTTVFIRYGFNLISQGTLDMYKSYVDMNDLPNYLNSGYWIYKRNIHNL